MPPTPGSAVYHRHILPAPLSSDRLTRDGHDGRDEDEDAHGAGSSTTKSKRKQVSVACEPCRRRKAKCDGGRPSCTPCRNRGGDCVYVADPDATRMATLKRRFETVNDRNAQLEQLFDLFRHGSAEESKAAFEALREGSDAGEVLHLARHKTLVMTASDDADQLTFMNEDMLALRFAQSYIPLRSERSASLIRAKMDVSALLSIPTTPSQSSQYSGSHVETPSSASSGVSAEKREAQTRLWAEYIDPALSGGDLTYWTRVTHDNQLLVHLISLFLAWETPTCHWADQAVFIDDIVHCRYKYCSSLLFNAMAAYGSRITPRFSRRSDIHDPQNVGSMFLREAMEQLESEDTMVDLCTIQAALVLVMIHNMDGSTATAMDLLGRVMSMSNRLRLFNDQQSGVDPIEMGPELQSARLTAWAVFNYQTFKHFAARLRSPFEGPPTFNVPLRLDPSRILESRPHLFPLPSQAMADYRGLIFVAYSNIQVVQSELTQLKYEGRDRYTVSTASHIFLKIVGLLESIPGILQPHATTTPHTLLLHMICHAMILDALFPLRDPNQLLAIPFSQTEGRKAVRVGDLTLLSRRQIASALDLQRAEWGFERGPMVIFQVFFITSLELRRDLTHDSTALGLFCKIVRAMREMAESWQEELEQLSSMKRLLVYERHLIPNDVWECLCVLDDAHPAQAGVGGGRDDVSGSSGPGFARGHGSRTTSAGTSDRESLWNLNRRLAAMESGEGSSG